MAVHAAAGLAAGGPREAARLLQAAEGLLRSAVALLAAPPHPDAPAAAEGPPTAPRRRRRPRGRGCVAGKGRDDEEMQVEEEEGATVSEAVAIAAAGAEAAGRAAATTTELPPDEWADHLPVVQGRARPPGGSGSGEGKGKDKVVGGKGKDKSRARDLLARRAVDLSECLGHRIDDFSAFSWDELHTMVGLMEKDLASRGGRAAGGGR